MNNKFLKNIHKNLSDEQVKDAVRIVENAYGQSKDIYRPPTPLRNGPMPESKYDRDRRYDAAGYVKINDLQPGHMYVLLEGDETGAVLTYMGESTPVNLLTPRRRYMFLKPNSTELVFSGFDFEMCLPVVPLYKIQPLSNGTEERQQKKEDEDKT